MPAEPRSPQTVAAAPAEKLKDVAATPPEQILEKWGIQVLSTRLTAAGYMLDFRYRVVAPEKAAALFDPKSKPYLVDEATGAKFVVPAPPKVGSMRASGKNPVANKNYFIFFANPGGYVKAGNKVSVVIGDFKIEHLTVE